MLFNIAVELDVVDAVDFALVHLQDEDFHTTVLLLAHFGFVVCFGLLFAKSFRNHTIRRDVVADEILAYCIGTILRELFVARCTTIAIGVSFDSDLLNGRKIF